MPRKRVRLSKNVESIVQSIRGKLGELSTPPAATRAELNDRVKKLVSLSHDIRELSLYHSQRLLSPDSASDRILEYLRLNVGHAVEGEAIDVVSAISEYPRRIREWRVEFGFSIELDNSATINRREFVRRRRDTRRRDSQKGFHRPSSPHITILILPS